MLKNLLESTTSLEHMGVVMSWEKIQTSVGSSVSISQEVPRVCFKSYFIHRYTKQVVYRNASCSPFMLNTQKQNRKLLFMVECGG